MIIIVVTMIITIIIEYLRESRLVTPDNWQQKENNGQFTITIN
jgi:hypothetical protein